MQRGCPACRQWTAEHPDVTLRPCIIGTKFGGQPVHIHLDIPDTPTLVGLNSDTAALSARAATLVDCGRPSLGAFWCSLLSVAMVIHFVARSHASRS